jgi:hypothetical protein
MLLISKNKFIPLLLPGSVENRAGVHANSARRERHDCQEDMDPPPIRHRVSSCAIAKYMGTRLPENQHAAS